MRVLVDTCVIIDALQSRVPFAETAQKLSISVTEYSGTPISEKLSSSSTVSMILFTVFSAACGLHNSKETYSQISSRSFWASGE